MTDAPAPEPPRATLGKYRIIGELGSGGMARVYLGLSTGLAGFTKLSVLKVMRGELAADPEAVKLFLGEARLAARFNHPNVVQTTEVGEHEGNYFIGMEYLEGLPLGTLLGKTASAPLPLAARLEIACQMLDGLAYLHELSDLDGSPLGLVHRDISPSNVFVTFDGVVKLLDFGVAKAAGVSETSSAGSFKGKIGYAAPEQIRGRSDARSDIFTAGLLLWEMLTYRRLAKDRAQADIVHDRVSGGDAQLMRSKEPQLPAPLLAICSRAAALSPQDRYQTAAALRDALRSYMSENALRFSAEQLRLLLAQHFDDLRRTVRKTVDQRLKQAQREQDPVGVEAGLGGRSHSQTPHPLIDATSYDSTRAHKGPSKRRRALGTVGGVALVLGAGLAGAYLVGRTQRRPALALEPSSAAVDAAPRPTPAATGSAAAFRVSDEPPSPEARDEDEASTGDRARSATTLRKSSHHGADLRRTARAPAGVRPADKVAAPKNPSAQPPNAPEKATRLPATQQSDFVHARDATKPARPIETASPYSN